jgi:hypothetical protein
MRSTGCQSYKSFSKLILTISLLLSLFAFSGFTTRSSSVPVQKTQTELVASLKKSRDYSYQRIFSQKAFVFNFFFPLQLLAHQHQRILKLRFNRSAFQFYSFKFYHSFLLQKTVSLNSDEAYLLS